MYWLLLAETETMLIAGPVCMLLNAVSSFVVNRWCLGVSDTFQQSALKGVKQFFMVLRLHYKFLPFSVYICKGTIDGIILLAVTLYLALVCDFRAV